MKTTRRTKDMPAWAKYRWFGGFTTYVSSHRPCRLEDGYWQFSRSRNAKIESIGKQPERMRSRKTRVVSLRRIVP